MLAKRIKLNLLFKLSYLNLNFALTLGYLNPALNNPALVDIILAVFFETTRQQDHEAEVDETKYAISGVSGVRGGEYALREETGENGSNSPLPLKAKESLILRPEHLCVHKFLLV